MAKKAGKKTGARKRSASTTSSSRSRSRASGAAKARKQTGRRAARASEETFPELGDLKDRQLMTHAKAYADDMHDSEEALDSAAGSKQSIRSRMEKLGISVFTGHGYEFTLTPGEQKFTARKVKRGSKPPDTVAGDAEETRPDHDFDTTPEGEPLDDEGEGEQAEA